MAEKQFEGDDPMELVGVEVSCDEDLAAESFIDEFLRLGMSDAEVLELFRNPFYRATHRIFRSRGEAFVAALIARIRRQWSIRPTNGNDEVQK